MKASRWLEQQPLYSNVSYNLYRTHRLLREFDVDPRQQDVFVIAGSKGKGTTAHVLAAILKAAGLKTGLLTSPHILKYSERIAVNGNPVKPREFDRLAQRVAEGLPVCPAWAGKWTRGELLLLMAMLHFRDKATEVGVLEVGLGGRLDPANIFPRPRGVCITSVSLEHSAILGNTTEQIAAEKAGILKKETPAFTGVSGGAYEVIAARARVVGCPLYGREICWRLQDGRWQLKLPGSKLDIKPVAATTAARHNRALAAAMALIHPRVTTEHVLSAINTSGPPGRFQVVPGDPVLVLDVAHTPASVSDLLAGLVEHFPGARLGFVAGFAADKQGEEILSQLAAAGPVMLMDAGFPVSGLGPPVVPSVAAGLEQLRGRADVVAITGSFSLVRQAFMLLSLP